MKNTKLLLGIMIIALSLPLLLTGCGIPQDQYDQMVAEKNTLQTQLNDANNAKNALQGQLDDVTSELDAINAIYPPRDFNSLDELKDWVSKNKQPETGTLEKSFKAALTVQQIGLEEGYLISVIYDEDNKITDSHTGWIYNGALADGKYYVWHPVNGVVHDWYAGFLVK